jgi:hypothetical protein
VIPSSRLLLRYETRLAIAPGPSPATKPPLSGLRRPSASSAPSPTFAHGPRGRQASTPWPSGVPCCHVGQRGPPLAAQRVGTTSPGHRARAAGTVAKIGTVCLRAKKTQIGLGAIVGGVLGRVLRQAMPGRDRGEPGRPGAAKGRPLARKKSGGRTGGHPTTAGNMRDLPAWHSARSIIAGGSREVKQRRAKREGGTARHPVDPAL